MYLLAFGGAQPLNRVVYPRQKAHPRQHSPVEGRAANDGGRAPPLDVSSQGYFQRQWITVVVVVIFGCIYRRLDQFFGIVSFSFT